MMHATRMVIGVAAPPIVAKTCGSVRFHCLAPLSMCPAVLLLYELYSNTYSSTWYAW